MITAAARLFGITLTTITLAVSLACAARKPIQVTPFHFLSEPENMIHYTVPDNCLFQYTVDNPRMRESIGVMFCWDRAKE